MRCLVFVGPNRRGAHLDGDGLELEVGNFGGENVARAFAVHLDLNGLLNADVLGRFASVARLSGVASVGRSLGLRCFSVGARDGGGRCITGRVSARCGRDGHDEQAREQQFCQVRVH